MTEYGLNFNSALLLRPRSAGDLEGKSDIATNGFAGQVVASSNMK
jgi:hypothetical protein